MQRAIPIRVQIGAFELHLKSGDLRQGARRIHLQGQPFQILLMLVERAGELVTREEIKKKLWPNDTVVEFDDSIHTAIKKLRQALSDAADNPKYIETVARRGYRLMVPVERLESALVDGPPSGEASSSVDGGAAKLQLAPTGLTGRTVSHYRVLDVIGGGGMGVVYKAEDLKLGRAVALKFLPEELGSDPQALERFSREARAASSLDHPNICPIHEFGEHEGRPFMVMQLLEGQTLRDRLADTASEGALPHAELLEIGIQVSDGLQAAHEKGIIHRDIKPANIFITNKGVCKILDFGLAKLLEADQEDAVAEVQDEPSNTISTGKSASGFTLTRTGVAMGTAGYMSPEQVRSEQLDARTDLFSFGLVLYEMAAGQRAFSGETAAIVHDAILNNVPLPVRELNSTLPLKLEKIIDKAIEKQRERRYQSAAEMRADLSSVKPRARPMIIIKSLEGSRWKLLSTAAIIVIALVASGLYWRRSHKTTTKLAATDTIVLADFVNSTGDSVFDALKTALTTGLQQSPFLNLLSYDKVSRTLKLINHRPDERLTYDLAREVCLRTNSKALVAGSIADAGNHYRIGLDVVDCHTRNMLATTEVVAKDRHAVVKALGEAVGQLREQLGEPWNSLKRFNQPLEEATSSSLEALQAYAQGRQMQIEKSNAEALPYVRRAIELDPKFAQAYAALSLAYEPTGILAMGNSSLAVQNLKVAYDLRNRAIMRDRFYIEGRYFSDVTGEYQRAIQSYTGWAQTYPGDYVAHANLTPIYNRIGQYEKAAAEARESLSLMPEYFALYPGLMRAYISLNWLDAAQAVSEEARSRELDPKNLYYTRYWLALMKGDGPAMQEQVAESMGQPGFEDVMLSVEAETEGQRGHFAKAHKFWLRAVDSAKHAAAPDRAAGWRANEALYLTEIGKTAPGRRIATEALAQSAGWYVKTIAAMTMARNGDVVQAQRLTEELNQSFPLDTMMQSYSLPTIRAAIELEKNNPRRAIEFLQPSIPYELGQSNPICRLYPVYVRGQAYLKEGHGQQAAEEFQKMLDHPGPIGNSVLGSLAHLQLGRAQVMMGDKAAARKSYQNFLTLWKDADPDIPIYRDAKAEYAKLQ